MALVPCPGLVRHEAGRELARPGKISSQVRCSDWRGAARSSRMVCVESLAESDQLSAISCQPSVSSEASRICLLPCQLRIHDLPPAAALHNDVEIKIANRHLLFASLDHIFLGPVHDGHIFP